MFSNKENINILTGVLIGHGVRRAVVCPGSRNAPIVHNLNEHPAISCYPITDERSAGFYALGMALATGLPTVVCITSGSALLNVAPAVAEAYYQHAPLIVISADRPPQWIGQLDGQTMPQPHALSGITRKAVNLPEPTGEEEAWHCNRLANEALLSARHHGGGPVHINVPLSEPLFEFSANTLPDCRIIRLEQLPVSPSSAFFEQNELSGKQRIMVVVGQTRPNFIHADVLKALKQQFVVLQEPLSGEGAPFDEVLANISEELADRSEEELANRSEKESGMPDLIIYIGRTLVSKRLRQFLRRSKAPTWLLTLHACEVPDPTMHLSCTTECGDEQGLNALLKHIALHHPQTKSGEAFKERWSKALEGTSKAIQAFEPAFSQAYAVKHFEEAIRQQDCAVHYANSTAIRLACLYAKHFVWCNRGVNGIEGSLSTAAGFSVATDKQTYCVIGDLSFFYDQNSLWNTNLKGNLRILLLNNGGGGIFHQLLNEEERSFPFVAGENHASAQGICQQNGIHYLSARNEEEFAASLKEFTTCHVDKAVVLEVFTTIS